MLTFKHFIYITTHNIQISNIVIVSPNQLQSRIIMLTVLIKFSLLTSSTLLCFTTLNIQMSNQYLIVDRDQQIHVECNISNLN